MHWFGIATLEITLDTNEYTPHYNNQSGIATAQSNNIQHMSYIANKNMMEPAISWGGNEACLSIGKTYVLCQHSSGFSPSWEIEALQYRFRKWTL